MKHNGYIHADVILELRLKKLIPRVASKIKSNMFFDPLLQQAAYDPTPGAAPVAGLAHILGNKKTRRLWQTVLRRMSKKTKKK